jgi:hypothetical protein
MKVPREEATHFPRSEIHNVRRLTSNSSHKFERREVDCHRIKLRDAEDGTDSKRGMEKCKKRGRQRYLIVTPNRNRA